MKIVEISVGKSLLFGIYEPLIPDELKHMFFMIKYEEVKKYDENIIEMYNLLCE